MSDQKRLFEHYNPLEDRVGKSFFEGLPKDPGVYKMFGRQKQLLYVGKAKNIRNRLFTYRRAKMETTSRKMIRLIRMTHGIDIEICETEKEALLLENKLIRTHRPEFNHAKKQPDTYYFIGINRKKEVLQFSLQMHHPKSDFIYGAFKGHRLVRKAMGSILRLLYMLENNIESVFELPLQLTKKLTPMEYELQFKQKDTVITDLWPCLHNFLLGIDMSFIEQLTRYVTDRDLLNSFVGSMILDDLDSLKWFFERCSSRNYQISDQLGLGTPLIPQEKLDDYIIEWVFARKDAM
ncbi:nucleotide excision repair endonuclease [Fodinibius sp. Rm-B-1B1-1]|uniref:nucleotide excision repair endonuclease n=1 Tax=Fodinibius alkaliphilus TaxID=3140241 RepID=UPI00315A74F2